MNLSRLSLVVGLGWSTTVIALENLLSFARRASCRDCYFPRGVPFTAFRDYTFPLFGGIVWTGLLADILFVAVSGVSLALLIQAVSKKGKV
jgi:hypothetical protein